ncbi:hypothetical protein LIER_15762 [Lithospermum erythrorhizon]|uniref:Uncharacterized protein n=1 Tax=Lithospermum erythrorhizon TaxID=34254 RepID=A0AAV3Q6Q5_LITER
MHYRCHGIDDTLDDDVHVVFREDAGPKKKSKKMKHKNNANVSEPFLPKKKLSKEERAAKRARKAERRARKAAEAKTTQDIEVKEVVPEETKEVIPPVVQPFVDD